MTINTSRNGNELTVSPEGRLDSTTSGELQETLEAYFTEEVGKLILNFEGVDYISSKGLRILVSVYKSLNGREMEIVNANDSVLEVFRLSGLDKTFSIH